MHCNARCDGQIGNECSCCDYLIDAVVTEYGYHRSPVLTGGGASSNVSPVGESPNPSPVGVPNPSPVGVPNPSPVGVPNPSPVWVQKKPSSKGALPNSTAPPPIPILLTLIILIALKILKILKILKDHCIWQLLRRHPLLLEPNITWEIFERPKLGSTER